MSDSKIEKTKKSTQSQSMKVENPDDDVQARYEALVKSGATAISSDMMFGNEESQANQKDGRWSTPAAKVATFGERLQDHIAARSISSVGTNLNVKEYKDQAKQTAG